MILAIGIVLMLLGAAGVWLAMTTPVQLQPYPAIVFLIGLIAAVFDLGRMAA